MSRQLILPNGLVLRICIISFHQQFEMCIYLLLLLTKTWTQLPTAPVLSSCHVFFVLLGYLTLAMKSKDIGTRDKTQKGLGRF
jgi:hypothetical protein